MSLEHQTCFFLVFFQAQILLCYMQKLLQNWQQKNVKKTKTNGTIWACVKTNRTFLGWLKPDRAFYSRNLFIIPELKILWESNLEWAKLMQNIALHWSVTTIWNIWLEMQHFSYRLMDISCAGSSKTSLYFFEQSQKYLELLVGLHSWITLEICCISSITSFYGVIMPHLEKHW